MQFRVELTARAERDLSALCEGTHSAKWLDGLEEALATLEHFPLRCATAPESTKVRRQLRQLLYGQKSQVYRIIFETDKRSKIVNVLTIRHGAMEQATPEDLG